MDILSLLFPKRCILCGVRGQEDICPNCGCALSRATPGEHPGVLCPWKYQGSLRKAIHRYKFEGAIAYARPFARAMALCINPAEYDALTYVPSSFLRYWKRGYNQCLVLTREVSRLTGLPVIPLLRRVRHRKGQYLLTDAESRYNNVKDAFALREPGHPPMRVLLVDDIFTTGATYRTCRDLLAAVGHENVNLLCIAKK